MSSAGDSTGATGSFAEESAALLGAFREWAAKGASAFGADSTGEAGEDRSGSGEPVGHGPECRYCPICQGIALLRGARPEVVEHLADALSSLAAAVTAVLAQDEPPAPRRPEERVQHIDVSGDG